MWDDIHCTAQPQREFGGFGALKRGCAVVKLAKDLLGVIAC